MFCMSLNLFISSVFVNKEKRLCTSSIDVQGNIRKYLIPNIVSYAKSFRVNDN